MPARTPPGTRTLALTTSKKWTAPRTGHLEKEHRRERRANRRRAEPKLRHCLAELNNSCYGLRKTFCKKYTSCLNALLLGYTSGFNKEAKKYMRNPSISVCKFPTIGNRNENMDMCWILAQARGDHYGLRYSSKRAVKNLAVALWVAVHK